MADRRYRDEDWLREHYYETDATLDDIAEQCNVHPDTVGKHVRNHGLSKTAPTFPKLRDEQWMQEHYCDAGTTSGDIADELGCSSRTVRQWAHRHGLTSEGQMQYDELDDEQWIRTRICDDEMTVAQIASHLGCTQTTVYKHLDRLDIEERTGNTSDSSLPPWSSTGNWVHADEWLTEKQLYRAYWEYFWSTREIEEWVGISHRLLTEKMNEHGIERRTAAETRRAKQLFRDDHEVPYTGGVENRQPHPYDKDMNLSAEEVRDRIGYGDDDNEYAEEDDDAARMQWTADGTEAADD